jgi:hypothetical protein
MISLLEDYVNHLRKVDAQSQSMFSNGPPTYYMPADSVSPDEWAQFDNVYQVHCPNLYLDNITRDVCASSIGSHADLLMIEHR